ncbi:MAG: 3-methyl-2-oxobutanoate hydroxymethyltransferase, partial [Anaerolineales bacterium]|nr:3-methyl-2-oxobutanoate hydroxymethyltransferase [Anaerolineales bacterium]
MTEARKKITLPYLFKKVADKEPITWLTCYDYPTAYLQEQAGIEMILVGDSLGMTMLGFDSTLPVKMDDMIRHSQAVRRGAPTAPLDDALGARRYRQVFAGRHQDVFAVRRDHLLAGPHDQELLVRPVAFGERLEQPLVAGDVLELPAELPGDVE